MSVVVDGFDLDRLAEVMRDYPSRVAYLEALKQTGGNKSEACRLLGRSPSNSTRNWKVIVKEARRRGYDPEHHLTRPVAPTQQLKRISTYHRATKTEPAQWVITTPDSIRVEEVLEAAMAEFSRSAPRAVPSTPPAAWDEDVAIVLPLTDVHIGMFSSKAWKGGGWDLETAELIVCRWVDRALEGCPDGARAVLVFLGDVAHYDQLKPVTNASGHVLDAAGSPGQMIDVTLRVMHYAVEKCLSRYDQVDLVIAQGNHDEMTMLTLAHAFAYHYEGEPRLTVDTTEAPFHVVEHGNHMLVFHHGHLDKKERLTERVAAEFREQWGRAKRAWVFCGHEHHHDEKDRSGATIIQLRTLAARSSYEMRRGWFSHRAASAFVFHRQHGEVGRFTWTPESVL